jgi:predicted alpha/beta hydrolase
VLDPTDVWNSAWNEPQMVQELQIGSTNRAVSDVVVPARDGFGLAATLFMPTQPDGARAVLIGPAMGVRRRFYARFAEFLRRRGFVVLTFDYRGTGGSAAPDSRGARLHQWGEQDLAGAIDWLAAEKGAAQVSMVAHSVSAQLLGLAGNNDRLGAVVLVAPQSGYWRLFGPYRKYLLAAGWSVGIPLLAALFGRLPGWVLGGMDVPAGVAREWARWGRQPDYILSHRADTRAGFARIVAPLLVFSMSDDPFAPPAAVDEIVGWYGSPRREHRRLAATGGRRIGHFDFFKEGVVSPAWDEASAWLAGDTSRDGRGLPA